jgi:hypothetical protein
MCQRARSHPPGVDFTSAAPPFFGLSWRCSYGGHSIYLSLKFKKDGDWFLASYDSAPALLAALLAVLIRNLSDNGIPAWLITPPVFVFVSYIMLRASFR